MPFIGSPILEVYKRMQGDYSVPKRWAEDPALGMWVNAERKRKKKLYRGEPSLGMPAARVAQLYKIGFAWVLWRDSCTTVLVQRAALTPSRSPRRHSSQGAASAAARSGSRW